jgi:hypothetical protein
MKTTLSFLAAATLLLGTGSTTFGKANGSKVTLSDFKGNYTGVATLSVPSASLSASGPVSLSFKTLKSGKSATVTVNGSISANGTTVPVSATISLKNGVFSIDNFVFNTLAQGSFPGSGSYTRTKRMINFQGTATVTNTTFPFSGAFQTSTKGHKQKITLTDSINVSGFVYTFTFDVSRHVQGEKK